MKRIYLDYAATTPVDDRIKLEIVPYFGEKFGNPSSLHFFGQEAIKSLDESREKIGKAIGAKFREIIFTGSATEANNLVLRGVNGAAKNYFGRNFKPRIIVSSIEHQSILETANDLKKQGVEITCLSVDKQGIVDLKQLKNSLTKNTVLVSVMYANNEIGTVEPIKEISKIIKSFNPRVLFHTDAVQALNYLDCNPTKLGVDLMTISSHKIYGPKGIGALYVKTNTPLEPIITGGGQEFGMRSGTENVAGIVGFAKAVEIVIKERKKEIVRLEKLRNYFWQEIKKVFPRAESNTPLKNSLPNNLNIYFPKKDAEYFLIKLDLAGIAISAGSACEARAMSPSHVLIACGFTKERIKSSLRFTLGRPTTKAEINEAIKRIKLEI